DAVDVGRARENGVMIAKENTLAGERAERWGQIWPNEIRSHPIPDHEHDALCSLRRIGRAVSVGGEEKQDREEEPDSHAQRKMTLPRPEFERRLVKIG